MTERVNRILRPSAGVAQAISMPPNVKFTTYVDVEPYFVICSPAAGLEAVIPEICNTGDVFLLEAMKIWVWRCRPLHWHWKQPCRILGSYPALHRVDAQYGGFRLWCWYLWHRFVLGRSFPVVWLKDWYKPD
jgi:hypothetical protein